MDEYKRFHGFTREKFIHEIKIFHECDIEYGDKGLKHFKKING